LGKCPDRRGHFGSIGLIATQLASDRQNLHGRYVLLILDASFDNASGAHPRSKQSNCGSEASGGGFQSRKSFRSNREDRLLIGLDHAMYSELRIDINQEVNMLRHDHGVEQDAACFPSNFGDDLLESPIGAIDWHLAPVLRTKDHVVLARKDDVAIRSVVI
jgi:hypothetical protein